MPQIIAAVVGIYLLFALVAGAFTWLVEGLGHPIVLVGLSGLIGALVAGVGAPGMGTEGVSGAPFYWGLLVSGVMLVAFGQWAYR